MSRRPDPELLQQPDLQLEAATQQIQRVSGALRAISTLAFSGELSMERELSATSRADMAALLDVLGAHLDDGAGQLDQVANHFTRRQP